MSIARAFTTRRVKQSLQATEQENAHQRRSSIKGAVGSIRHKISSPIELIHTTNMLSYNAPDIQPMTASSTGSSQRSDDDMSDSAVTNSTTPPTSPDVESSPKRSRSPEPNHLSAFFTAPVQTQQPAARSEAPVIPQRALSHSKKPYDSLGRQRSMSAVSEQSSLRTVSTKASFTFSRSSSSSTSTSVTSHGSIPPHHRSKLSGAAPAPPVSPPRSRAPHQHRRDFSESRHPFGQELAQVSELAEEYGVKEQVANVVDVDQQEMLAKGLLKLSADDYLSEVRVLFANFLAPRPTPVATTWI